MRLLHGKAKKRWTMCWLCCARKPALMRLCILFFLFAKWKCVQTMTSVQMNSFQQHCWTCELSERNILSGFWLWLTQWRLWQTFETFLMKQLFARTSSMVFAMRMKALQLHLMPVSFCKSCWFHSHQRTFCFWLQMNSAVHCFWHLAIQTLPCAWLDDLFVAVAERSSRVFECAQKAVGSGNNHHSKMLPMTIRRLSADCTMNLLILSLLFNPDNCALTHEKFQCDKSNRVPWETIKVLATTFFSLPTHKWQHITCLVWLILSLDCCHFCLMVGLVVDICPFNEICNECTDVHTCAHAKCQNLFDINTLHWPFSFRILESHGKLFWANDQIKQNAIVSESNVFFLLQPMEFNFLNHNRFLHCPKDRTRKFIDFVGDFAKVHQFSHKKFIFPLRGKTDVGNLMQMSLFPC